MYGQRRAQRSRSRLTTGLTVAVALIIVATALAMFALRPDRAKLPDETGPYEGKGVSIVDGTVDGVKPFDCNSSGEGPNNVPAVKGYCATVQASLDDGSTAKFTLDPTRYVGTEMESGNKVQLIRTAPQGERVSYEFYDFQRNSKLLLIAVAFVVVVSIVGRWRGVLALCGVGVAMAIIAFFVLPGLLTSSVPVAIAAAGSTAIMIVVLYLAHGVSARTTAALFGSLFGIAFTAVAGAASAGWTHLTGIGSEDDRMLLAAAPHLDVSGIVAATIVVAGLGVLNDVTVTQASAVWEMRAISPESSKPRIFASAMRLGRDHIASSIYTLVFAYAGSAMTLLLLVYTYPQNLIDVISSEQISQEIVRTLIGAIGLVLAMPVTTAFAIAFAPRSGLSAGSHVHGHGHGYGTGP